MKFISDNIIAIYTENGDGSFDELIVDVYNKHYDFWYNCCEQFLLKSRDKNANEFLVEPDFFYAYFKIVDELYSGSYGVGGKYVLDKKQLKQEEIKSL